LQVRVLPGAPLLCGFSSSCARSGVGFGAYAILKPVSHASASVIRSKPIFTLRRLLKLVHLYVPLIWRNVPIWHSDRHRVAIPLKPPRPAVVATDILLSSICQLALMAAHKMKDPLAATVRRSFNVPVPKEVRAST